MRIFARTRLTQTLTPHTLPCLQAESPEASSQLLVNGTVNSDIDATTLRSELAALKATHFVTMRELSELRRQQESDR